MPSNVLRSIQHLIFHFICHLHAIGISIKRTTYVNTPVSHGHTGVDSPLHNARNNTAIIIISEGKPSDIVLGNSNFFQASEFHLLQESQSWFVVTNAASVLLPKLKSYSLGLNTDLVLVEFPTSHQDNPGKKGAGLLKPTTRRNGKKKPTNGSKLYDLYQIYKIRPENDTSLIVRDLGSWDSELGFGNVEAFLPVELRNDFYGFPLILGLTNFSMSEDFDIDVDYEEDEYIQDFLKLIVDSLNAR